MNEYRTTQVTPELLAQYAKMTKSEILLHLAIKARAVNGKIKRNINRISVTLGTCPKRLREAESRLNRRGLLHIQRIGSQRWWLIDEEDIEPPQPPNFWQKISQALRWRR